MAETSRPADAAAWHSVSGRAFDAAEQHSAIRPAQQQQLVIAELAMINKAVKQELSDSPSSAQPVSSANASLDLEGRASEMSSPELNPDVHVVISDQVRRHTQSQCCPQTSAVLLASLDCFAPFTPCRR